MQEKSDIFNGSGKAGFKVPEGYFEGLKVRLNRIPEQRTELGPVQRIKPYLALAASFAAILIAGNVVLRSTAERIPSDDFYEELGYVSLLQADEYLQSDTARQDTISDEDVINYLIDSGVSAELIEYTGLLAQK